jgi:hypothetical protein
MMGKTSSPKKSPSAIQSSDTTATTEDMTATDTNNDSSASDTMVGRKCGKESATPSRPTSAEDLPQQPRASPVHLVETGTSISASNDKSVCSVDDAQDETILYGLDEQPCSRDALDECASEAASATSFAPLHAPRLRSSLLRRRASSEVCVVGLKSVETLPLVYTTNGTASPTSHFLNSLLLEIYRKIASLKWII